MDIPVTPLPDHLKQKNPVNIPIQQGKPPGWWSVSLKGSRAGVLSALASSNIPDHAKTFLKAEIDALEPELNFIALDAHYHLHGGKRVLHHDLTGSTVL